MTGQLAAGGVVDDDGDDEFVIAAQRPDLYPTRLTVLGAATGQAGPTLWHWEQISGIRIINDYFEDGATAIVAWGQSHKLDGCGDGLRPGERQFGQWDLAMVAMVLRADAMDVLAPPVMSPAGLAVARIRGLSPTATQHRPAGAEGGWRWPASVGSRPRLRTTAPLGRKGGGGGPRPWARAHGYEPAPRWGGLGMGRAGIRGLAPTATQHRPAGAVTRPRLRTTAPLGR